MIGSEFLQGSEYIANQDHFIGGLISNLIDYGILSSFFEGFGSKGISVERSTFQCEINTTFGNIAGIGRDACRGEEFLVKIFHQ